MSIKANRKKILILAGTVAILTGAWQFFRITQANAAAAVPPASQTYTITRGPLRETLTVSGSIDAEEKATLRFQTSGFLTWIGPKVGDRITKYQAIASLDRRELQKRLQKYLLSYQKTRWDFDQTKDEYQQPPYWGLSDIARREIDRAMDKAQFDLNSSVLDVEIQDLALQFSTLTSPISGILTNADITTAGVNITPAQAEFDVVNPDTLYLSVLADQTEVIKLATGSAAELTLDPFPDERITGTISSIAYIPKAGESGTVYEVKIKLPKTPQSDQYRLGMTGDATFVLGEKDAVLSVPSDYLKTDGDKKYVWLKTEKGRTKQYVTTGIETDNAVEIISGVRDGDVLYD